MKLSRAELKVRQFQCVLHAYVYSWTMRVRVGEYARASVCECVREWNQPTQAAAASSSGFP